MLDKGQDPPTFTVVSDINTFGRKPVHATGPDVAHACPCFHSVVKESSSSAVLEKVLFTCPSEIPIKVWTFSPEECIQFIYNFREYLGSVAYLEHLVNSAHYYLLTSPRLLEWVEILFHHKILSVFFSSCQLYLKIALGKVIITFIIIDKIIESSVETIMVFCSMKWFSRKLGFNDFCDQLTLSPQISCSRSHLWMSPFKGDDLDS